MPDAVRPRPPADLLDEYRAWQWEVAWDFVPETIVHRLTHPTGETRYLKLTQVDWYPGAETEAERLRWARAYLPVPEVVDSGSEASVEWMMTWALPGEDATQPRWRSDVERLVRALGRGLRRFHEAPVGSCPFDFRIDAALAHAGRRLQEGRIDADRDFHEEFAHLDPQEAIARLHADRPASESLVVCHGDYCLPNVLLAEWEAVGFLDLGELGVADRWWDLAVATWSLEWNLGPGYESVFLSEYGVEADEERMRFYRLLYDVVS